MCAEHCYVYGAHPFLFHGPLFESLSLFLLLSSVLSFADEGFHEPWDSADGITFKVTRNKNMYTHVCTWGERENVQKEEGTRGEKRIRYRGKEVETC